MEFDECCVLLKQETECKYLEPNCDNEDDDWAEVELSRWQTGELPDENSPPLNIPLALKNISNNIETSIKNKNMEQMITPFNLCSVLRYLAKFEYE